MKHLSIIPALFVLASFSCSAQNEVTTSATADHASAARSAPQHEEHHPGGGPKFPGASAEVKAAANTVIDNYLGVKNALANDDAGLAAKSAQPIIDAVAALQAQPMDKGLHNSLELYAADISENAQHIGGTTEIEHQRMHFMLLTEAIEKLVGDLGSGKPLYKDFCPMANDGKGAYWFSETEEIHNPYFGAAMPHCGSLKGTY